MPSQRTMVFTTNRRPQLMDTTGGLLETMWAPPMLLPMQPCTSRLLTTDGSLKLRMYTGKRTLLHTSLDNSMILISTKRMTAVDLRIRCLFRREHLVPAQHELSEHYGYGHDLMLRHETSDIRTECCSIVFFFRPPSAASFPPC